MARRTIRSRSLSLFLTFCAVLSPSAGNASESPMADGKYAERVKQPIAGKYQYIEDGDFSKALNIPVYEWLPIGTSPKIVVLGIHGFSMHGRRFRVLARILAANGIAFVALDMRGFGACFFDKEKKFSTANDDKSKIDLKQSYKDIVQLSSLIKKKYDRIKVVALGECFGCTYCTRLAGEHPELVDGMILSGPTVKVNPSMYMRLSMVPYGLKAIFTPGHQFSIKNQISYLVSSNRDVTKEALEDPFVRKQVPLLSLFPSKFFVDKTAKYGKPISAQFPVLIFQSRDDGCVSPKKVIDLVHKMKSVRQTLSWRESGGHLQLETSFMRSEIVEHLLDWLYKLEDGSRKRLEFRRQEIIDAGGQVVD